MAATRAKNLSDDNYATLYQRFKERIYIVLNYTTFCQRFKRRIYFMLNYATLYQRFKQRIYIMLNDALIQVTGYLKPLASRVCIVECPQLIPNKTHDKLINKHKMHPALRENLLGDVIFHVARKMSRCGDDDIMIIIP